MSVEKNGAENLQNLIEASKKKLENQKKGSESVKDLYAEFREGGIIETPTPVTNIDTAGQVPPTPIIPHSATEKELQEMYDAYQISDEELFPDGPKESQIALWKKQFDKSKIIHIELADRHFIFRTLNRFEYKKIVGLENTDALYREEVICSTVTLWPVQYDFRQMGADDAGIPSTLSQIIMENSGFTKEYGIEVL